MIQRRSMLMRLFGLFGFASTGLNVITEACAAVGGDSLAIRPRLTPKQRAYVVDALKKSFRKGPLDASGRYVDRIEDGRGVQMIRWDHIKPGDWLLITDRNELGCPYQQTACIAVSAPDLTEPDTMPFEMTVISRDEFWVHAANVEYIRKMEGQLTYNKWRSHEVMDLRPSFANVAGKNVQVNFQNSWD